MDMQKRYVAVASLVAALVLGLVLWMSLGGPVKGIAETAKVTSGVTPELAPEPNPSETTPKAEAANEESPRAEPKEAIGESVKASVNVPFLLANGSIAPQLVSLFGVTSEEKKALEEAVLKARNDVTKLSAASARIVRADRNGIDVLVPPFAGGDAIWSEFIGRFVTVLGEERAAALVNLEMKNMYDSLYALGTKPRSLVVTRASSAYSLFDLVGVEENEKGGKTVVGGGRYRLFKAVEALGPQYEWLAPHLEAHLSVLEPRIR